MKNAHLRRYPHELWRSEKNDGEEMNREETDDSLGISFSLWLNAFFFPRRLGDIEIEAKKQLDLEGKPLDIGASLDGEKLFILVEGKVLIYSIVQGEILDSIPVAREFDRLSVPGKENVIALSSSSGKRVEIIRYKTLHKIDISGLPFKGLKMLLSRLLFSVTTSDRTARGLSRYSSRCW